MKSDDYWIELVAHLIVRIGYVILYYSGAYMLWGGWGLVFALGLMAMIYGAREKAKT